MQGRQLRLMIPVNIRGNGDVSELGNKITFRPINVPLDVRDPRMLLAKVSERMVFLRSLGVENLVGLVGTLVSKVPYPVQAALVPVLTQLPLSLANMICTNVPGPQQPLYLLGHKMLRAYPYVPIGGEMGVNVAILSYNGTAYVGFGGDVHAVPDIDRFEELLRVSFAELRDAAVGKPPQTERSAPKTKAAASPQAAKRTKIKTAPASPPTRPKVRLIPTSKPETPKRRAVAAKTSRSLPNRAQGAARSHDGCSGSAGTYRGLRTVWAVDSWETTASRSSVRGQCLPRGFECIDQRFPRKVLDNWLDDPSQAKGHVPAQRDGATLHDHSVFRPSELPIRIQAPHEPVSGVERIHFLLRGTGVVHFGNARCIGAARTTDRRAPAGSGRRDRCPTPR